jgi:hypothetical protein
MFPLRFILFLPSFNNVLNVKKKVYCSAAILDITEAFDKVWHPGLLFKIRRILPPCTLHNIRIISIGQTLSSKIQNEITTLRKTESGVQQGRVLGPVLYLTCTSDLPTSDNTTTATFADVTVILPPYENPR